MKWYAGCPILKLLCKSQFRGRDFQRFLWKCCSSTFNTCFIQWFHWFLFCRESQTGGPHGAAGTETVLGRKDTGSKIWGGHWIPARSKVFALFLTYDRSVEGTSKRRIFLTGINWLPLLYELLTNLCKPSLRNVFMWAARVKKPPHPSHVRSCPLAQFSKMKFSHRVRTILPRKWQIRMKYKPVS